MHDFRWPALVTLGVVVLMAAVAANVVRARIKYGVRAPAVAGNPGFERAFRVQLNTIESAVMFLPVLWLFAAFVNGVGSAVLGAAWLAARVWYALAYQKHATKRGPPFVVSMFVVAFLWLGAAWGVLRALW